MEHVVAADLVGAVREPVRVRVARRGSSSLAVLAAPQASTTTSAAYVSVSPSRSTTTPFTARAGALVSSFTACAFVSSVTFGCSSAGRTPNTSASDLPCTDAREAVAVRAADAGASRACSPRSAGSRTGRGTAGSPPPRDRRGAAACAARARRPGTGTARSPAARSGPRRARRAPGRAARPACSTARARRR